MIEDYINNFQNIVSSILFVCFKLVLITLVVLLIFSLIMLAVGCLIKSQKIKSKFLITSFYLFIGTVIFLAIPFVFVYFKNKM